MLIVNYSLTNVNEPIHYYFNSISFTIIFIFYDFKENKNEKVDFELIIICFTGIILTSQVIATEITPVQSIAELQKQLEKELQESHIPGMSIAIVHKDGPK